MCIGCREMKNRNELIRIVRTPDGAVVLDKTGKTSGRGAYICKDVNCFMKLKKSHGLDRSFKTSIPESVYEDLEKEMSES